MAPELKDARANRAGFCVNDPLAPAGHIVRVNHEGGYKGNWLIFTNRMCVS
jgi:hypothetical protein